MITKFERIISTSQSKYKAKLERKNITQQCSYNLPIELEDYLNKIKAIKKEQELNNRNGTSKNILYGLENNFSLELGNNILAIIGKQYESKNCKVIFTHTEGPDGTSKKMQLKKTDFESRGEDYKWFVDLYDKNIENVLFVAYVDDDKKILRFDIELSASLFQEEMDTKEEIASNFKFDDFIQHSQYSPRFITSLLAKPFVILAGISGSGKTKIATDFAKWLSKKEIGNWKLISVGSDWTDNTKILGYYNPLLGKEGTYCKTEIIKLIERANENEKIPFFLILDEMNLSRAERYFSDFLSKMETIKYTDGAEDVYFNLDHYQDEKGNKELKFPKNLFIIGTVNIDETTYMFSPKVLDRANVIEFTPDNVMDNFETDLSTEDIPVASNGTAESFLKLALETRKTKNLVLDDSKKRVATKILREIYNIFEGKGTESTTTPESKETQKKEFKEFGFAYRTVKEIRHYINAAVILKPDANVNEVMDEQVLQKILPKIHGNRKQLDALLKGLKEICDKNNLAESSKKIENMQKKLETNQFTSFI